MFLKMFWSDSDTKVEANLKYLDMHADQSIKNQDGGHEIYCRNKINKRI